MKHPKFSVVVEYRLLATYELNWFGEYDVINKECQEKQILFSSNSMERLIQFVRTCKKKTGRRYLENRLKKQAWENRHPLYHEDCNRRKPDTLPYELTWSELILDDIHITDHIGNRWHMEQAKKKPAPVPEHIPF